MPTVRLQSSDGHIFEVDTDVAKVSVTIRGLMHELGIDENGGGEVLPLPHINADLLEKIIGWAREHRYDPPPPANGEEDWPPQVAEDGQEYVPASALDRELLEGDHETLYQILVAAHKLQIRGLLVLACKAIANLIHGKTPEELREMFNTENDFSPEELEQVRQEYDFRTWPDTPSDWAARNLGTERQVRSPHDVSERGRRRAAPRRLDGGAEWFQ